MNLRTLLVLGRISNLPTVCSNLLAGWVLARGGFDAGRLALLLLGGIFLYIGGMYLNDFCDAAFDAQYVPTRPIPAGSISRGTVGILAVVWFALGIGLIAPLGPFAFGFALLLTLAIIVYDFWHKGVAVAPFVMGACRFFLYPMAASALVAPVQSMIYSNGALLGAYVVGITSLARDGFRSTPSTRGMWVLLLLPSASVAAACCIRPAFLGITAPPLVVLSALQLGWMAWLLIPFWSGKNRSIGRVVSGLLAGIVLVDSLILVPEGGWLGAMLLPLFPAALVLQRFVPAT
jgi:4-hydroxybenzoate polyprenyltransferase